MTNSESWNNVDAASVAGSPIISLANSNRALEPQDSASQGIFGFNTRDRRSRPFNLLRAQISKIMRAKDWRAIGITSATPDVGKSFTAINLAASLSRIPQTRTLLLDLDLRRGSVAERFRIPEGPGINSFLAGEIDTLDEVAYDVSGTGLTIFPCFPTNASSATLLSGTRFSELVAAIRSLPGSVVAICDLPPAFANDDAAIVLRDLDAYMFVVEEGKTTANQVRDSVELLKPAPCMGTVLNRYKGGLGSDDYGFGYGTSRNYDAYYS